MQRANAPSSSRCVARCATIRSARVSRTSSAMVMSARQTPGAICSRGLKPARRSPYYACEHTVNKNASVIITRVTLPSARANRRRFLSSMMSIHARVARVDAYTNHEANQRLSAAPVRPQHYVSRRNALYAGKHK